MTPFDRAAAMVTPPAAMDPPAGRSGSDQRATRTDPSAGEGPLERALTYPYEAPAHSYLFRDGAAVPVAIGAADRANRIPVLACG